MPEPTPDTALEDQIRGGLADLVAAGPDPAARTDLVDARMAHHSKERVGRREVLIGAAAATVAGGLGVAWLVGRDAGGDGDQVVRAGPSSTTTATTASTVAAGAWLHIESAPLGPRHRTMAVWADDRLIVLGGSAVGGLEYLLPPDAVAWSAATGAWESIAPMPAGVLGGGFAVWTGRDVVVGLTEADSQAPWNTGSAADAQYGVAAFDPVNGAWRYLAPLGAGVDVQRGGGRQAVVTADGAVLIARRSALPGATAAPDDLVIVDPVAATLEALDPGPFAASPYNDASGTVGLAVVGNLLVATPNWDLIPWVLELSAGTWRRTTAPPGADSLHLMPGTAAGDRVLLLESDRVDVLWVFDPSADGADAWRQAAPQPTPTRQWTYDPVWSGTELLVPGAAYDQAADSWRTIDPPPRGPDRQRSLLAMWTGHGLVLFGGEEYSCPDNATCDREVGPDTLDGWLLADP